MELWVKIKNFENYEISNLVEVRNTKTGNILKPHKNKNGYLQILLRKDGKIKCFYIHRLIAECFIPNPDNLPCINHKDENKLNNNIINLEWCSYKYNANYGTFKERVSKAHKGKSLTKEHRQKMSFSHKGQEGYWKGKHRSDETKQKISLSLRGMYGK